MTLSTYSNEQQKIQDVIREYQQQGYEVISPQNGDNLPEFLANHQPDLVVRNRDETVVIEVKTRSTLQDAHLYELAQAIEAHPGWRLDLVMLNEPQDYQPIDQSQICDRIANTRQLIESGFYDAALLLAWSAVEATLRQVSLREGIVIKPQTSLLSVIKTFFSLGLIARSGYDVLTQGFRLRSQIAHGLQPTDTESTGSLDARLIQSILDVALNLLEGHS